MTSIGSVCKAWNSFAGQELYNRGLNEACFYCDNPAALRLFSLATNIYKLHSPPFPLLYRFALSHVNNRDRPAARRILEKVNKKIFSHLERL
jgi:hypothetical protein